MQMFVCLWQEFMAPTDHPRRSGADTEGKRGMPKSHGRGTRRGQSAHREAGLPVAAAERPSDPRRELEKRIQKQLGQRAYQFLHRDLRAAQRAFHTLENIVLLGDVIPEQQRKHTADLFHAAHDAIAALVSDLRGKGFAPAATSLAQLDVVTTRPIKASLRATPSKRKSKP